MSNHAKAVTFSTVSFAVTIVGAWIWITNFVMLQSDADAAHAGLVQDIRTTYLELKIDAANGDMAFIEQNGIDQTEQREYDLLKFSVERMTASLMDLQ